MGGGVLLQAAEHKIKHYSIVSDIVYFIRHFKKHEPWVLVFSVAEILLRSVIPLLGIWLPKITVDLVVQGATVSRVAVVLGSFTLLMMAVNMISTVSMAGKYHLYNMQRANQIGMLFLKSLRIPYSYTESGEVKQLYWKAYNAFEMGDWSASSRMVTGTVGIIISALSFLLYSTVIGTLSGWLLLCLTGLAFLNYVVNMGRIRYEESLRDETAQVNKRYNCVSNSMGHVKGAKDIRIFAMHHWLIRLRDKVIGDQQEVNRKLYRKRSLYEKIGFLLSFGRDLGAYGFLLYQALEGRVSVSEFVLYFGAITGFSGFVLAIMNSLSELRAAANSADYLRAYMNLPEEDVSKGDRHISELTMPLQIEFVNVSFSYQDAVEDGEEEISEEAAEGKVVFEHLDLTIHAGEKIALVGVNGAGKTTLVKLLCGMYDPDEGKILLNGIDRREFPKKELYQLFSVVFQEPLVLPFTVGENLVMDKADRVEEDRAWEALEKAGLKTVFEEKKIRLDTYMTKRLMNNGIELSGGQQQRFLLARALYKDAPVLVLDEPTAALDPIAEKEVYENYNRYSGGKTAVFISHRLASTRFSDRIVLLEDGKITEMGTHEELLDRNGKYAEMFRVQSNYYEKEA